MRIRRTAVIPKARPNRKPLRKLNGKKHGRRPMGESRFSSGIYPKLKNRTQMKFLNSVTKQKKEQNMISRKDRAQRRAERRVSSERRDRMNIKPTARH